LAKWLTSELKSLTKIEGLYVKNSFEFVDRLRGVKLEPDEIMVSFDVESLFPSIPIPVALVELENHLNRINVDTKKKKVYLHVAKLCMEQNYFQFRGSFYRVEKGTSMGNPLSPLIAEVFMSAFELKLQTDNVLPRVWIRYVDDVYAIIKRAYIDKFYSIINNQFDSIKFTVEYEKDNKIPFLDLLVERTGEGLAFSVYHKPTSATRYITNDSHTPIQHKVAAFHSMVHRLCKLPLSITDYMKEYTYIKHIADVNGYKDTMIDQLIMKHTKKIKRSNSSSLFSQNKALENIEAPKRRVNMTFVPEITNKLKSVFSQFDLEMVFSSRNKLRNLLGSTKDKTEQLDKSGIYEIGCNNCNNKYIGQTKRSVNKRFTEHEMNVRLIRPTKSAVAEHVLSNEHSISLQNVRLVKEVNNPNRLDAYESIYIGMEPNTMNLDNGNISSPLFSFI
jgi:hypothetical protein